MEYNEVDPGIDLLYVNSRQSWIKKYGTDTVNVKHYDNLGYTRFVTVDYAIQLSLLEDVEKSLLREIIALLIEKDKPKMLEEVDVLEKAMDDSKETICRKLRDEAIEKTG